MTAAAAAAAAAAADTAYQGKLTSLGRQCLLLMHHPLPWAFGQLQIHVTTVC